MFGCNNYGEIPNTLNPADGDPWDVIVPGYPPLEIGKMYKIKKLDGIIVMPHGNHKLIVDIDIDIQRKPTKQTIDEVYLYRKLYSRICKKRGNVILYDI
jgi:inorganic pyrophosphatase